MTIDEIMKRPTTDVQTAGREFYGLGKSASYAAAKRGDIPTLRVGRKLVVPVRAMLDKLEMKSAG